MHLAEIHIYPIKSLDGLAVDAARFATGGGLEHDRSLALFDAEGNCINGKREAAIHRVRAEYQRDLTAVTLSADGIPSISIALADLAGLSRWFTEFLGREITVRRDAKNGFPDDHEAPGPTVVSRESLEMFAEWFPQLTADEMLRRLRPNLILVGGGAFAEDRLFGPEGIVKPWWIGNVELHGSNPCQRCVVPTRDSRSGETTAFFQKEFSLQREASLPSWVERSRFNHYYRAAVNTRTPAASLGRTIRTGDAVRSAVA